MATHNNGRNIVSLPSLSNSLNALPNATSMSNLPLHPSMYRKYADESEAKLQKAFMSKTSTPFPPQNTQSASYMMPPTQGNSDATTLMMRRPARN